MRTSGNGKVNATDKKLTKKIMGRSNKYGRFNIIILNHIEEGRTSRKTPYEIWHNKNIDFEDFKALEILKIWRKSIFSCPQTIKT